MTTIIINAVNASEQETAIFTLGGTAKGTALAEGDVIINRGTKSIWLVIPHPTAVGTLTVQKITDFASVSPFRTRDTYLLHDLVSYNGDIYKCIDASAASTAGLVLDPSDPFSSWEKIGGDAAGTNLYHVGGNTYNAGDIVAVTDSDGVTHLLVKQDTGTQTPNGTSPLNDPTNWVEYSTQNPTSVFPVLWTASHDYITDDRVIGTDGLVYIAVKASLNQNPVTDTTDTYWKTPTTTSGEGTALDDVAGYVSDKEYEFKDLIAYRGDIYINTTGKTDPTKTPDVDTANWSLYVATVYQNFPHSPDAGYKIGDVVSGAGGKLYSALVNNPALSPDSDLADNGALNSWAAVDSVPAATVNNAFNYNPYGDYKIGDIIAYNGVLYRNKTADTDPAKNPSTDNINWEIYKTDGTVDPAVNSYITGQTYLAGDLVYGSDGVTYRAVINNPTENPVTDSDDSSWAPLPKDSAGTGDVVPVYNSGAKYKIGDMVGYDGQLYVNLTGDTNNLFNPATDTTNWRQFDLPAVWSTTKNYAIGDTVLGSDGRSYMAVAPSTAAAPQNPTTDNDDSHWMFIAGDEYRIPVWMPSVNRYAKDDLVAHNGVIYRNRTGANTVVQPNVDTTNWLAIDRTWSATHTATVSELNPSIVFNVDLTTAQSHALWINGVMISRDNFTVTDSVTGTVTITGPVYAGDKLHLESTVDDTYFHNPSSSMQGSVSQLNDVDVSGGIPDGSVLKWSATDNKWLPKQAVTYDRYATFADFIAAVKLNDVLDNSLVQIEETKAVYMYDLALANKWALMSSADYVGVIKTSADLNHFALAQFTVGDKILVKDTNTVYIHSTSYWHAQQDLSDASLISIYNAGSDWRNTDKAITASTGSLATLVNKTTGYDDRITYKLSEGRSGITANSTNSITMKFDDELTATIAVSGNATAVETLVLGSGSMTPSANLSTMVATITFSVPVYLQDLRVNTRNTDLPYVHTNGQVLTGADKPWFDTVKVAYYDETNKLLDHTITHDATTPTKTVGASYVGGLDFNVSTTSTDHYQGPTGSSEASYPARRVKWLTITGLETSSIVETISDYKRGIFKVDASFNKYSSNLKQLWVKTGASTQTWEQLTT